MQVQKLPRMLMLCPKHHLWADPTERPRALPGEEQWGRHLIWGQAQGSGADVCAEPGALEMGEPSLQRRGSGLREVTPPVWGWVPRHSSCGASVGVPALPGRQSGQQEGGLLLTLGLPGVSLQALLVHSEEREDRTLGDSCIKLNESFIEILSFLPLFVLKGLKHG